MQGRSENENLSKNEKEQNANNKANALLYDQVIAEIEDYAIILLDTEGNIISWNKGAEKIKGYSADEILGKNFRIFYPEEDRVAGLPDQLLEEAKENGSARHEGWRVGNYEDVFWAYTVITAMHDEDGNHIGYIKITRDLSERVAAENVIEDYRKGFDEQVKKTSEVSDLFQSLVTEVVDYAIFTLDKEGHIQNWNKGAEKIKGYSANEIIGRHFSTFYPEEDRQRFLPDTLLYKARVNGRVEHEGWRVRKDGTHFWGNVTITVLHNPDGSIKGYCKITKDLTDKMLAEKATTKYIADLELEVEKVKTRDLQLRKTYELLNKSTKVRSRFVRSVTDDFQVPIDNIIKSAEELRSASKEEREGHINHIISSARNIKKRTQDLALLSIVLESKMNLELVDMNIHNFILELLTQNNFIARATHDIQYSHEGNPQVRSAPLLMKYIVENIVQNSIRFSNERSVILVHTHNNDEKLTLQIKDQGIGIPQEEQKYMFESFFRGSNTKHTEGTGLSMYLVKNFTELMGGTIDFQSAPNKGTTFTITFPANVVVSEKPKIILA